MAKRDIRLTPTSYIVLGLISTAGRATPYELKQTYASGMRGFWTLNHAQLYAEPDRLVDAGYLTVEQEQAGRRRKVYELTALGRRALEEWLENPAEEFTELRDPGLLQLFFGADPRRLAAVQLDVHERALARLQELKSTSDGWPEGPRLVLESGIGHEREWIRYWKRLAGG